MTNWIPVFHDDQQYHVRFIGEEIDVCFDSAPEPFTWLDCDPDTDSDEFTNEEKQQAFDLLEHLADNADVLARYVERVA